MDKYFLAGIVTFNPYIPNLTRNIQLLKRQGITDIFIVDNGSDNINEIETTLSDECYIQKNNSNMGIAHALNQIGKKAEQDLYTYFFTFDQDSIVSETFIEKTKEVIASYSQSDIGMICPYINRHNDFIPKSEIEYINCAITSGSLVSTYAWKTINGFWEYLFIDEVDHEFCYRLRRKGFKIIFNQNCCIQHVIGNPDKNSRIILGHKFHPTNHSPFRRYYMTRNSILMLYLYPEEKEPFPHRIQMILRIFVSITVCEEEKLRKYKAIAKGIRDACYWILKKGKLKKMELEK